MNRRNFLKAQIAAALVAFGGIAVGAPKITETRYRQPFVLPGGSSERSVNAVHLRVPRHPPSRFGDTSEWKRFRVVKGNHVKAGVPYVFTLDFKTETAEIIERRSHHA